MTKQSFPSNEDGNLADGHKTTLGKALPIQYGKSKSATYGVAKQETPVYGSSGQIGTFDRALTTGPTLIVGRKGSAGAVHYSPAPCWPIDTVYYAQEVPGTHLPFFRYLIEHLRLGKLDKSTTIPSLSRDDYNATEAFIPPVEKQREIVGEIEKQFSRLDEAGANVRSAKARVVAYRASVLSAVQSGTVCRMNCGDWPVRTIGELATKVQYGSSAKTSPSEKGIPVLRMGNIENGELKLDNLKYLPADHDEFPELFLETGDLLFNRTNSPELVGKVAVYKGKPSPCSFASYLIRVRFIEDVLPEFAAYVLNSPFGRAWVRSVVSQQVGQANVNGSKLKAFQFRVPSITMQRELVAEAERHFSLIRETETQLSAVELRSERLRTRLLASAFSGGAEVSM